MQVHHRLNAAAMLMAVLAGSECLTAYSVIMRPAMAQDAVSFNRDVRPILSTHCYHCHGPDAASRQAELRLDDRDQVVADRADETNIISPGQPQHSELWRRITTTDSDLRMPPEDTGKALTPRQIRVLTEWIQQGAKYEVHWAFVAPQRPQVPELRDSTPQVPAAEAWVRNDIDRFVLAELQQRQLQPAAEASAATLIRRMTLDLTGLPPTETEVNEFETAWLRDRDVACQQLAERLLASPRYAERMTARWLDAARYADTNGYFTDENRVMWPWRDWVINAFQNNMPFDQFTIEQLAGDLLPDASLSQKVATGFNRNHMVNNETGIIEEEYRVEYVVDRVDTTATVWLGLTVGCARCHDHKFDPVSQRSFYELYAFFNNVPERGLSGSSGNSVPVIAVPSPADLHRQAALQVQIEAATKTAAAAESRLRAAEAEWEAGLMQQLPALPNADMEAHDALDERSTGGTQFGTVQWTSGLLNGAVQLDGESWLSVPSEVGDFDTADAFSCGVWVQASGAGCVLSRMDDEAQMRGFDLTLRKGRAEVNLVHAWNRDAIQVSTVGSIPFGQWQHLMFTYDGSGTAAGVTIYLNGEPQPVQILQDNLTGSIRTQQPLRIGRRQSSAALTARLDELRIYRRQLSANNVRTLADGELLRALVSIPAEQRTDASRRRLTDWFLKHEAEPELAQAAERLKQLKAEQKKLARRIPTTMIMQEAEQTRATYLLTNGQYDSVGEQVWPRLPKFLVNSAATDQPQTAQQDTTQQDTRQTRLHLAQWLVDRSNPLTARVTVNRLWEMLFGIGIVRTSDDFGTQGAWPSHPALLDWLAVELIDSGWNLQHILKLMVTSATYRQTSHATPEQYSANPENRWLSRGSRFRLEAEVLRDHALAISGLLVEKQGGPSVMPYQPPGLWQDVSYDGNAVYQQSQGADLYRRSLYTFWKRQSPPPTMLLFDSPTRETCTVQRSRTNTPLQALAVSNDPTFVEAARHVAQRLLTEPLTNTLPELAKSDAAKGASDTHTRSVEDARLKRAFRMATARYPAADELQVLRNVLLLMQKKYRTAPDAAEQLIRVGSSPPNGKIEAAELAAWTAVASMILCLDETLTRP